MTQARKTHKPVQVDIATNPYTTLTANPAGHFTAQEFLDPQRAKVDGSWRPIDTTLVRNADGSIRSKVTLASVRLSGGGTGPLARVDDGAGHALTFTWPGGALPVPALFGDTATYADVYPGVDLKMVALPTGVQDLLVVHNAKAAANPALTSIRLGVTGTGLSVGAAPDGGVTADDAKGQQVFGGPAPLMWDSAAAPAPGAATGRSASTAGAAVSPHLAKLSTAVSHGSVTVTPDRSLLTSRSTVYPVTIDPQWVENPQNWLELWSNGHSVYDGSPAPYGGYDTSAVRVGNSGGTLVRSLLSFSAFNLPKPSDFSAHPGDQSQNVTFITGAFLNLTSQSATCPSTQAWRANPFNTGSNWSNQNGGSGTNLWPASGSDFSNPIATFGGSTNCKNNWFSVNLTNQVRDVYNSGGDTYTIGLRAANEGSATNNYGSYFVQNAGGYNANVTVNVVSEPWWGTPSLTSTPIGNHGRSTNPCGATQNPVLDGFSPALRRRGWIRFYLGFVSSPRRAGRELCSRIERLNGVPCSSMNSIPSGPGSANRSRWAFSSGRRNPGRNRMRTSAGVFVVPRAQPPARPYRLGGREDLVDGLAGCSSAAPCPSLAPTLPARAEVPAV